MIDLKEIQKPVEHLLVQQNRILKTIIKSKIGLIKQIKESTPLTKGKKIRSTLLFLLAGLNNGINSKLPKIAAAIEMLHNSSLIHDDIVDNSDKRRGNDTVNSSYGNSQSLLYGDYLFINSFYAFNKIASGEFLDTILTAARLMVEGQMLEIENNDNYGLKSAVYFKIIEKKTSSLFAAVAKLGFMNSKEPMLSMDEYFEFGLEFGNIFQISDDLIDIFSNNSGKGRFKDLIEGKITLPIILFLQKNDPGILKNIEDNNLPQLISLFTDQKIKEKTIGQINKHYQKCQNFLKSFPDSKYKQSLNELIDFIKYRDY